MKKIFSILLLTGILISTGTQSVIFFHYLLNKAEITEKYCVNKNKPEKKCHGQCHVNKQMKQVEEQDKTPVNPLKEKAELQLFAQDYKDLSFDNYLVFENQFYAYQAILSDRHLPSVDHPPLI